MVGATGDVAIADERNNRVMMFDREGNYLRQFGARGGSSISAVKEGQFLGPTALASDAHGNIIVTDNTNRLQVFSSEGKHLCTNSNIGLNAGGNSREGLLQLSPKYIAWGDLGQLAITNANLDEVRVWAK